MEGAMDQTVDEGMWKMKRRKSVEGNGRRNDCGEGKNDDCGNGEGTSERMRRGN